MNSVLDSSAAHASYLLPRAYKVMKVSALMRAPEIRLAIIGQDIACTLLFNQVSFGCCCCCCEPAGTAVGCF
jgi:hypothetical protein